MFFGTIPKPALDISAKIIKSWDCRSIHVGCSGNFTFERMFSAEKMPFDIHSNDVSLYSGLIGHIAAGKPFPVSVSHDYMGEFGWLLDYMNTPTETLATVMIAMRMLEGYGKSNLYYDRMQRAYLDQWGAMHAQQVEKLESLKDIQIKDFYYGDVIDFMDVMPEDAGFVSFPPFWTGGYEKLYKRIHEVFEFPKADYKLFDKERKSLMLDKMREKKEWLMAVDFEVAELAPYMVGRARSTARSKEVFIYSSKNNKVLVKPHLQTKPYFGEKLKAGEEIGDKITFEVLEPQQFQAIKTQYLDIKIAPASVNKAIGVRVDDRLIGCFAVTDSSIPTTYANLEPPYGYLLSDFSISGTSYKHLSKLVLYAILSHEAKGLIERLMNKRVTSVVTTIFTNRPKSMKYRGLFEQISKKEGKPGVDAHKFILNYGARLGQWSLDEALKEWKEKYGEKV